MQSVAARVGKSMGMELLAVAQKKKGPDLQEPRDRKKRRQLTKWS